MTQTPDKDGTRIPTYSRGTWSLKPHPIAAYDDFEGDYEALIEQGGFIAFTEINPDGRSLIIKVYRRDGADEAIDRNAQFLITLETPLCFEPIAATDAADVMDLLAKWAPAVQASILGDLWEDASYDHVDTFTANRIASIAALATEGVVRRDDWAKKKLKRNAERRQRAEAAARKPKQADDSQT